MYSRQWFSQLVKLEFLETFRKLWWWTISKAMDISTWCEISSSTHMIVLNAFSKRKPQTSIPCGRRFFFVRSKYKKSFGRTERYTFGENELKFSTNFILAICSRKNWVNWKIITFFIWSDSQLQQQRRRWRRRYRAYRCIWGCFNVV